MAVSVLSRPRLSTARSSLATPLPIVVLVATLVPPALDLFGLVQRSASLPALTTAASAVAGLLLLGIWLRHPRAYWLAAAWLATAASVALRLLDAQPAAWLSLLTVIGLGIGGGFASPVGDDSVELALVEAEAQPSVARR